MDLQLELELSLYEEIKNIHKSSKSEITLVYKNTDNNFYIKKTLKEYTKDIYTTLMSIKNKHIPRIYEIFEIDDKLIIIEEFINGETLQNKLEKNGIIDEMILIDYMIDLCIILGKLHNLDQCIIHRDIKPSNIIINSDNILKLIDFDISRTYKYGENIDTTLLGTKGYASPEQFGFEQTDCRSDIYAMGVMMNVLSTGKHFKEVENKGLLKDIIKKCIKISPDDRYDNVRILKNELEKVKNKNTTIKKETIKECKKEKLIKNCKKETNLKNWINNNLPGFRNGNIMHIIPSILFYIFMGLGLMTSNSVNTLMSNILMVVMFLSYFFLYTNFMDIKDKLPFTRSIKLYVRIWGYFLYSSIIFFVVGIPLTYFT